MGWIPHHEKRAMIDKMKYEREAAQYVMADAKRKGTDKGPDASSYNGAKERLGQIESFLKPHGEV